MGKTWENKHGKIMDFIPQKDGKIIELGILQQFTLPFLKTVILGSRLLVYRGYSL